MGDGQHIWSSAEWVLMMIHSFVMKQDEKLIVGAGIFPEWLKSGQEISIGIIPTAWGPVRVCFTGNGEKATVRWEGQWRGNPPEMEVRIPGFARAVIKGDTTCIEVTKNGS
jgi:hypothetical protein